MSDSVSGELPVSPAEAPHATAAPAETRPTKVNWTARIATVVLVLCAGGALFWPRGSELPNAPAGSLYDLEGQSTTLGTRLQPVTLVHFWATWCSPCIQEVPALRRLSDDFASRHQFAVVMIAVADSKEKVRTFLGSGASSALFDPSWEVAHRYGTRQIPESYLIVNGQIVEKFVGQTNWDDPSIRGRIDRVTQGAGV
jgi:thiol-disulfide isomerase/thioredoxin